MKKLLALVLALAMLACVFAGCETTPVNNEENNNENEKVWIIATDTVFKPFEYTDANGNFVGIDVDILAAIAEGLQVSA